MSITMWFRLFVLLFGSLLIISGLIDLSVIPSTGFEWLSIAGNTTLKVFVGLFMIVLAVRPNAVQAILKIIIKKEI
jgi:hypothetical protein